MRLTHLQSREHAHEHEQIHGDDKYSFVTILIFHAQSIAYFAGQINAIDPEDLTAV